MSAYAGIAGLQNLPVAITTFEHAHVPLSVSTMKRDGFSATPSSRTATTRVLLSTWSAKCFAYDCT